MGVRRATLSQTGENKPRNKTMVGYQAFPFMTDKKNGNKKLRKKYRLQLWTLLKISCF